MAAGCIEIFHPLRYGFSSIGAKAFSSISEIPEYKEKLRKPISLEPKDKVLTDFGIFAIIAWLKMLSVNIICLYGYGRNYLSVTFDGKNSVYELPKDLVSQNLFLKSVSTPIPLNLPENTTLEVKKNTVILDCQLMKITIRIRFTQWVNAVDLRTRHLLDVSEEDLEHYSTLSGVITFDADFEFKSIFSRNAEKYYLYAQRMLENLRCNYGWPEFIKSVKEEVFWKHMLARENTKTESRTDLGVERAT